MDDDARPLTAEERKRLRDLIKAADRSIWLWASIRIWALWVTAIAAAATLLRDGIRYVFRLIVQ